ncbi:hypothetical protein D8L93_04235 [Sodalis-like symbiont of Bactericera trigonica]|nr:hypothetical protein D8L93_04235 [Sodalis-like symbiont of Bactericera trigonica]
MAQKLRLALVTGGEGPIMRLHRPGTVATAHLFSQRRADPLRANKSLTLQRKSVLYAARAVRKNITPAPLFNNLSDNLCGHSQDDIDIPQYKVLKSKQQIFI